MQPNTPDKRLLEAAKNGNIDAIRALIAEKVDLNARDEEGYTALHLAAYNGHVEAVRALVKVAGDEIIDIQNSKDRYYTPLHYASRMGHAEVVTALLELGANPMIADVSGRNPLHNAAENGCTEVARVLGKKVGAKGINICNPIDGFNALHYATEMGYQNTEDNHTLVKALIELKADVNAIDNVNRTPLWHSAGDGDVESVKILIENGADIEGNPAHDKSPLRYATEWGHVEVLKVLLKNGAFVSEVVKWGEHAGESVIDSYEDLTDAAKEEMYKIFFKYGAKISPEFLQIIRDDDIPDTTKKLLESYTTKTEIEARDKALREDEDLIKAHKKLILNGKLTLDSAKTLILYNEIFGDVIVKAINSITKEELDEIKETDSKKFEKIQKTGFTKLIETSNIRNNNEATKVMLKNPKEFRVFGKTISNLLLSQPKENPKNPFYELHELLPNIVIGLLPPKLKEELQHLSESSTLQFIGDLLKASSSKINEIKKRETDNVLPANSEALQAGASLSSQEANRGLGARSNGSNAFSAERKGKEVDSPEHLRGEKSATKKLKTEGAGEGFEGVSSDPSGAPSPLRPKREGGASINDPVVATGGAGGVGGASGGRASRN